MRFRAFLAVLAAAAILLSCVTEPAAPASAAAPAEPPSAAAEQPEPATAEAAPAAAAPQPAAAAPRESAQGAKGAEASFPRRAATAFPMIVAALHEPSLPVRAASLPVAPAVAASPSPQTAPVAAPAKPAASASAPTAAAAPPQAKAESAPKTATPAPKPAAKEAAKPAAKPAPKAAAVETPKAVPLALPLPPASSAEAALVQPERQPDIARSVAAEAGMRVEVPFDGTGWTYLGERTGREGVLYESRRFEGSGLVFVLLASKPGDYALRFQRQDALRGIVYDELVSLKVSPKAAVAVPPAPAATETGAASGAQGAAVATGAGGAAVQGGATVQPAGARPAASASGAQPAPPVPSAPPSAASASAPAGAPAADTPEGLVLAAKNELGAGRVQGAIEALDRLLARYPSGTDEAFYLYGLALEQNGPLKDVKRAYALYRKVCSDYPQSAFWDAAAERASYIERHYFEIR